MTEQALIRLKRLASLRMGPQELSDRVGGRYTYWRDLLNGNKSFGEKIARKAEQALRLPRGWLDEREMVEAAPLGPNADPLLIELSPTAIDLAKLFDMLPDDRITRTVAYCAATTEILKVLRGDVGPPEEVKT